MFHLNGSFLILVSQSKQRHMPYHKGCLRNVVTAHIETVIVYIISKYQKHVSYGTTPECQGETHIYIFAKIELDHKGCLRNVVTTHIETVIFYRISKSQKYVSYRSSLKFE